MSERAFYDTVVFVLSLNAKDPDGPACGALLDIESGGVLWGIVLSAITRGEATLEEYLNQLEQRCALQGVEWVEVGQDQVSELMRKARALKSKLEQAGMQSRDIKQVFAASSGKAVVFVTRDRDFFDPQDKGQRGKKKRGTNVRDLIVKVLEIEPLFPVDALARLQSTTEN